MKIKNKTKRMLVLDLGKVSRRPMTVNTVEPGPKGPMPGGSGSGTRFVHRKTRVNASESITIPAGATIDKMPGGHPITELIKLAPGVKRALRSDPPTIELIEE